MGKLTGFMEYERREPGYRPVEERVRDYRAVELRSPYETLTEQAARCMDCGTPFCHGCGCPLRNVVPEFNEQAYQGRWEDALAILLSTNNFPEFTGRVCPAPCEGSCVLGITSEPVAIRQIELAIIERAFEQGLMRPRPPKARRQGRVAVVGSGPAGLAAADTLNKMGFNVVVYDSAAKAGGILRYGIPEFKLEKSVVDRRVALMEAEGVVFEMGVRVGEDVSYRFLRDRFDAICLCAGARRPRDLVVPGRELVGIHFAMEYLVQQNKRLGGERIDPGSEITAEGKAVLVIGGGDTGSDCVGTAVRQGAASVVQLEVLPRPPPTRSPATPWPMWPQMLRTSSSHKEGCERHWGVATRLFEGAGGKVESARTVDVEWTVPAGGGAPVMVEKPGTERVWKADLVLLAMGFAGPKPNKIVSDLGIRAEGGGVIWRGADNMTSVPGIFVSGDMSLGASLVVRAIGDGRKAAQGIGAYLSAAGR